MANIYKQNDKRKKVVPGGDQTAPVTATHEEVTAPAEQQRGKSLTRNISITLQEEAIEKLNRLAEEQDISKSKVINRWLMSL